MGSSCSGSFGVETCSEVFKMARTGFKHGIRVLDEQLDSSLYSSPASTTDSTRVDELNLDSEQSVEEMSFKTELDSV